MRLLLLICLLLTPLAHAHEAGKLTADSQVQLSQSERALTLDYRVLFIGPAAAAEWKEADRDANGVLSEAEQQAYYAAEASWLASPLELVEGEQIIMLGKPRIYALEGSPSAFTVHLNWTLELPPQAGRLSHPGVAKLSGRHRYMLALPSGGGTFSDNPMPRMSWSVGGASFNGEWNWDNSAGELQEALQSKSLWGGLLLAFFLGGVHALTPGHGKTIVGAYLIGSRGTVSQAVLLGLVVTFTHTFSVILLGLACLFFFQKYLPPGLIPWIGVASGVLMTMLGLCLLTGQAPTFIHHHHHDDDHHHHHHHGHHHHHHHHHIPDKLSLKGLISLGITGGMVPCPEALAVLLSALALNKLIIGMLILLAFSSGLAAVLVAIGIIMVTAARLLESRYPSGQSISKLSDLSYTFMVLMGLLITGRSFLNTGWLQWK